MHRAWVPRRKRPAKDKCKHCGKTGLSTTRLVGHIASCKLRPDYHEMMLLKKENRKTLDFQMNTGTSCQRLSRKVENGTWHFLSLGQGRMNTGVKFHGMWEVKYANAMYLDDLSIK